MQKIIVLLFIAVSFTAYAKEWVFELNANQIRMYSDSTLKTSTHYIEKYSIKNMVNLSFFTSRTFIPPYKDLSVVNYKNPKRWPYICIDNDGTAIAYKYSDFNNTIKIPTLNDAKYIVAGFPLLLRDGKKIKASKSFFSRRNCPRTAIGIHPNGSMILYVSTSATIKQVQDKLFTLGCIDAINLDGGSSTFLYLDGKKVYSSNKAKLYPNVLCWD